MATGQRNDVVRHLRELGQARTDADLLGCYLQARDEASFATLVRRHGPMV